MNRTASSERAEHARPLQGATTTCFFDAGVYKVGMELHAAAGMDGLVASPLEARSIRALAGPKAILVTPGVRSEGASKGDQKRIATPAEAIRAASNA